jgi:hypothetical protein
MEIGRDGMLWRDEWVTHGSRWEIKKVKEYDPERLETEGRTLHLSPPVLEVQYFYWNHAPRTVQIGKDLLRRLKLSLEDWQVSGDQIVTKGQGGYDPDDDKDFEDDQTPLPRFPDQRNFGPRDLWDEAKCWFVRTLSRGNPGWSDRQTLEVVIDQVQKRGWPWLAEVFICNVPEEIRRRLEDGMPMSPNYFAILDHLVRFWMESGLTKQQSRTVFNRKVVIHGWEHSTGAYRNESNELEYVETIFRDYAESA